MNTVNAFLGLPIVIAVFFYVVNFVMPPVRNDAVLRRSRADRSPNWGQQKEGVYGKEGRNESLNRRIAGKTTQHETRFRIVCHLPSNDEKQEAAVRAVVSHLQDRSVNPNFTGFTISNVFQPAFTGYWYSEDENSWIADKIVLCTMDYRPTEREAVSRTIGDLKSRIGTLYSELADHPEQEIWIVAHEVVRLD
jgi:hypothetical protein